MEIALESNYDGSSTIHYCEESFYPKPGFGTRKSHDVAEPWNKT